MMASPTCSCTRTTRVNLSFLDRESKDILGKIYAKISDLDDKMGLITEHILKFTIRTAPQARSIPFDQINSTAATKKRKVDTLNLARAESPDEELKQRREEEGAGIELTPKEQEGRNSDQVDGEEGRSPSDGQQADDYYQMQDTPSLKVECEDDYGPVTRHEGGIEMEEVEAEGDDEEEDLSHMPTASTSGAVSDYVYQHLISSMRASKPEGNGGIQRHSAGPSNSYKGPAGAGRPRRRGNAVELIPEDSKSKAYAWGRMKDTLDSLALEHPDRPEPSVTIGKSGDAYHTLLARQHDTVKEIVEETLILFGWGNSDEAFKSQRTKILLGHIQNNSRNWRWQRKRNQLLQHSAAAVGHPNNRPSGEYSRFPPIAVAHRLSNPNFTNPHLTKS